jgi:hypothetical protein
MIYVLFLTAIALSTIAAAYAVVGLMAVFAASATSIMIMGGTLEAAKLVVASWLYRNWREIPILMKTYFTAALVILMLITSMGIFGYLSKAHLDQAVPTGDLVAKLNFIDEQIENQRENINAARTTITQLDAQVNETLRRTEDATNNAAVNRSVTIRRQQAGERQALAEEIKKAQEEIARFNSERQPIAQEVRQVEAEVGPIKYIAALIYGDNPSEDLLAKSVRWLIILIVIVFDPLAVLMLIAWNREVKKTKPGSDDHAAIPIDDGATEDNDVKHDSPSNDEPFVEPLVDEPQSIVQEKRIIEEHPYLTKPFAHFSDIKPMVAKEEPKPVPPETETFLSKVDQIIMEEPKVVVEEQTPPVEDTFTLTPESDVKEIVKKPISGRPERYK